MRIRNIPLLLVFVASSLFGYCKIAPWRSYNIPVPFWLNELGTEDIADTSEFEVLRNSAYQWNLPSTFFSFVDSGFTTVNYVAYDGISILYFDNIGNIIPPGQGILGVTYHWGQTYMLHWDIIFNDHEYTWSISDNPPSSVIDLMSVAVHELGHAAGLTHPGMSGCGGNCGAATMWYAYASGTIDSRSLELDDIAGITDLHANWSVQGSVKDASEYALYGATLRFVGTAASRPSGRSGTVVGVFPDPMPGDGADCDTYEEGDVFLGSSNTYQFMTLEPQFELIAFKYGYYPETLEVNFPEYPDTLYYNFVLDSLSLGLITGSVLDSITLSPVQAKIFLYAGDSLVKDTVTDANGSFTLEAFISAPPSVEYDSLIIIPEPPYSPKKYADIWISETPLTIDARVNAADVLLVDDDEGDTLEKAYIRALDSLDVSYSLWDMSEQGSPPPVSTIDLLNHNVVVWFTGDSDTNTLTQEDQDGLIEYLDSGGNLFLSGQNIGEEINESSFYSDYLHAGFKNGATTYHICYGVDGDPVGDGLIVATQSTHQSQDVIYPLEGAYVVFTYQFGDTAGIRYASQGPEGYKVVYFGFGFEAIKAGIPNITSPKEVMARVLSWLDTTFIEVQEPILLQRGTFRFYGARPNPFKKSTSIGFQMARESKVSLLIYDSSGRKIKTLLRSARLGPGLHSVIWDGRDDRMRRVPNGTYFSVLKTDGHSSVRSLLIYR